MKSLFKCQETTTTQQEIYYLLLNLLIQLYLDLSRQTNTNIDQQINFTGKLEEGDSVIMFWHCWKSTKTILNFSLDSLIAAE